MIRANGPCYFCGRLGAWRSCCNQYMCDAHFSRLDMRALAGGYELAKRVLKKVTG